MYKILKLYRNFLNSHYLPSFIKRIIQRIGIFFHNQLFNDRHTRLQPYQIVVNKNLKFTMMLDWMDYAHSNQIFYRLHEPDNVEFILNNIEEGDTCVDLGANSGYFSLIFAKAVPNTKVYAVEPVLRNNYFIKSNLEANKIDNIKIIRAAISDKEGQTIIQKRYLNSGAGSISGFLGSNDEINKAFIDEEEVKVMTIDKLFEENNISKCKILKMDIQGTEADAIIGADNVLKNKKIDYLIVEHNPGKYGEKVRSLLKGFGYNVFDIKKDGSLEKIPDDQELVEKVDYIYTYK